MAMVSPSAWVFPVNTPTSTTSSTATGPSLLPKNGRSRHYSNLTVRASSSDVPDGLPDEESKPQDPAKLAFAKAKAYRNAKLSSNRNTEPPDSVKQALQRAKEYKENKGVVVGRDSSLTERTGNSDPALPESVKLAMERARDYEKNKGAIGEPSTVPEVNSEWRVAAPDSVKSAMSRDSEYEKNRTAVGSGGEQPPKAGSQKIKMGKPEGLKVSSLDFLGFDFSDKKKGRGIPAGLVPTVDPSIGGDLPEVEIIVGDMSKFESSASATSELSSNGSDENAGLYKPKVSTWGVFPRPSNISKAVFHKPCFFGGGKNIRPGEVLESTETKAVKEERTRQMIAAYQNKIGLTIDAKVKAECEKAMKEGNQLMDAGKLREALPYYEKIMNRVVFKFSLRMCFAH
ncbi:unnamed protein product [Spirodela intermedia]|uniref:Uncharacterized protein n=1 Tax=Spirodela intermedia TaxID=51605 RepID=A0A7I8J084_SPIIN|nr:unnamed protein product [Spirodela intermedia]CAA6663538.1 unnamed protein product [Spirodela intermedia]